MPSIKAMVLFSLLVPVCCLPHWLFLHSKVIIIYINKAEEKFTPADSFWQTGRWSRVNFLTILSPWNHFRRGFAFMQRTWNRALMRRRQQSSECPSCFRPMWKREFYLPPLGGSRGSPLSFCQRRTRLSPDGNEGIKFQKMQLTREGCGFQCRNQLWIPRRTVMPGRQ